MYQVIDGVKVWGVPDSDTIRQMQTCREVGSVADVALMADHHKGYSQPIGGVVAYLEHVSPSGVGYDIACGNKAVCTDLKLKDVKGRLHKLMDRISSEISFGIGRKNPDPVDHELFSSDTWTNVQELLPLKRMAYQQLGTVGSGNHYVDIMVEPQTESIWVAVHFGSRGFGHKTASGFLNLAHNRPFDGKAPGESMDQPPTLLPDKSPLGEAYIEAMTLAGRYAYAGRDIVVNQVLGILEAKSTFEVHNHHNFAWRETLPKGEHSGQKAWVIRKGATPCYPGQLGFIGGSMADISVIVRGKDSEEARLALHSTVHGAGRIMSRTKAAGKMNYRTRQRTGGLVDIGEMRRAVASYGVELRGAGADEAPMVYRKLQNVLDAHSETLEILHVLRPIGVAMAGENELDPYKD